MTDSEDILEESRETLDYLHENNSEKNSGGLPTAAEVKVYETENGPHISFTEQSVTLNHGDELVRKSDVKALIQDRLKTQEQRVEKYNAFDKLNLNDAKARKQELESLLEELEGEASE